MDLWYVARASALPFRLFLRVDGAQREIVQGHQWYLQAEEAGGVEKRFLENFGNVVRWNGPFGVRLALDRAHTIVLYSNSWLK